MSFSFGVVADVQYGDFDNRLNYDKTRTRYYRNAIQIWQAANEEFSQHACKFVLHLGDFVDGFNGTEFNTSEAAADALNQVSAKFAHPIHHVVGNHDLNNFSHKQWRDRFLPKHNGVSYYDLVPSPGFRFIALDSYEISALGYDDDLENPNYKSAIKLLEDKHRGVNDSIDSPDGLVGPERRFVRMCGGLSDIQLAWLEGRLQQARSNKEQCFIFGHLRAFVHDADNHFMTYHFNVDEISSLFTKYSDVIIAYLCGHEHEGSYFQDSETGIHHITFQGVVETKPGESCHGIISVTPKGIHLKGYGRVPSRELRTFT